MMCLALCRIVHVVIRPLFSGADTLRGGGGQRPKKSLSKTGLKFPAPSRGGYNSDDITKGGGGGLLSQEAVMKE